MSFEPYAAQPQRPRAPMHTVMTTPQPDARPPRTLGRWIGGPVLAAVVGLLTVWIAGLIAGGSPQAAKNRGRLRLSSDPEGATVLVEGKVHPSPTPTVIDGEIGATLHVGFKLDGYFDKEADVFVGEGERPFRAKLDRREVAQPPPPPREPPPETSLAPPEPVPMVKEERPRPKKEAPRRERVPVSNTIAPVMSGTNLLSVHVHPWAIVYVDGAKIRQTPLDGHTLTAGLHTVELVNDGLRKKEKVTVEVRANGSEEIRRDWEK